MSNEKKQEIVMNVVQGDGETIEEIMSKPRDTWSKEHVEIGIWGEIALKMFQASPNSHYLTLCSQGKSNEFLQQINEECREMNIKLQEEMRPKTTGDWMTDYQNLEAVQREINEIIIKEVIEPLVKED